MARGTSACRSDANPPLSLTLANVHCCRQTVKRCFDKPSTDGVDCQQVLLWASQQVNQLAPTTGGGDEPLTKTLANPPPLPAGTPDLTSLCRCANKYRASLDVPASGLSSSVRSCYQQLPEVGFYRAFLGACTASVQVVAPVPITYGYNLIQNVGLVGLQVSHGRTGLWIGSEKKQGG